MVSAGGGEAEQVAPGGRRGRALDRLADAIDFASYWTGRIVGWTAILGTVFLIAYEVVARYVFNSPTQFTLEIGLVLQIVVVAGAAAYVLQRGGHVGIELVTERLSRRARAWAGCWHAACGIALCTLIGTQIWQSATWSAKMNRLTQDMEQPIAPVQFLLFAGLVLLALQFAVQGYRSFRAAQAACLAPAHGDDTGRRS